MQHIDEYTIELYLLEAKEVAKKRREIERHLRSCVRCMTLHDDIAKFYSGFTDEFGKNPHLGEGIKDALVRRATDTMAIPSYNDVTRYYEPLTKIERFQRFVGRNAVPASVGVVAIFAVLLLFLVGRQKHETAAAVITDVNPTYSLLNQDQNKLEVYNGENQELWKLPVGQAKAQQPGDFSIGLFTHVVDLDADGKNEVLSSLHFLGSDADLANVVHIYDGNKKLRTRIELGGSEVTFLGKRYVKDFGTGPLDVVEMPGAKKDIFVSVFNTHSPFFLAHISSTGAILGEYWHFGHLRSLALVHFDKAAGQQILMGGVNDLRDDSPRGSPGSFPVIVILKPVKLIGGTESSATRGFGFPPTDCEEYYVRFPRTDMGLALHLKEAMRFHAETDSSILFYSYNSRGESPLVEYTFSKRMDVVTVNIDDVTYAFHEKMKQEGKITGTLDKKYLKNLKDGIRYWDGQQWRKEVTKVLYTGMKESS